MKCYICRNKIKELLTGHLESDTNSLHFNLCETCFNNVKYALELCRDNCSPVNISKNVSILMAQNNDEEIGSILQNKINEYEDLKDNVK